MPDPLQSLANRHHPDLPNSCVTAYTGWSIRQRVSRWFRPDTDEARFQHFIDVGKGFAERVRADLQRRGSAVSEMVFFGYDTGSREVLQFLQGTGCFTIVDQINPGRVEKQIVLDEIERWPGWARKKPVLYNPYYERRREEWALASVVVVNSEWSKQALVKQGVPGEKICVVPLAYEPPEGMPNNEREKNGDGTLQVLWLGTVELRKGIQYLVDAAHRLENDPVQFSVVGPVAITEEAVSSAPPNVTFHGRVSRDEVHTHYRKADVFILPTLSDGFAITQLEAMAHGLPVIATPNCGRVVEDGNEGLVVPPRDGDALAEAIAKMAEDPDRVWKMSGRARTTAQQYTIDQMADHLTTIVENRCQ